MAKERDQNGFCPRAAKGLGLREFRQILGRISLLAIFCSAAAAQTPLAPDPLFNPQPLADDLELPLPCGGKMVFRYIYVLGKGLFDDRGFNLGYAYSEDEPGYRQAFLAGYRNGFVTGQFLLEDLPPIWRDPLSKALNPAGSPSQGGLQPVLYFIGKYEVTDWQYRLVMSQADAVSATSTAAGTAATSCPPADSGGVNARLPKVNLSWFDALRFTEVYSQWLARSARDRLPAVAGGPEKGGSLAFIRLPSEAEWEFAARGGHKVDRQGLEERLFPRPVEGGGEGALGDWAVYRAVAGGSGFTARLMPIGSKRPNPVGLHDILGNAAEMMLEPFQMVRGSGRVHGASGGFVVKGGNYTEGENALFTGMRREYPFFNENGTSRRNETTGFRVVVAAITAPTARLPGLFEQWQQDGRIANLIDVEKIQDPTQRLDAMIAASQDEKQKKALSAINAELKHTVGLLAEQRKDAVANLIKSAALIAETVSNYQGRLLNLQEQLQLARAAGKTQEVSTYESTIANGNKALRGALAIYVDNVASCINYPDPVVQEQADRVRDELGRKEVIGRTLLKRTDLFLNHVQKHRKQLRSDPDQVLRDILQRQ
ncbi:MAG TPA: SUMF1/EgtB/PvdO family nonheme iron enzyme [Candidatus Contendobacter sp.]|nr:SUMF1/EgtB/PvdO family nonheme iron enzyme [Candidatus Contendobacter sp.]HRD48480.1 SUMF1/EgtB/PvdO family nonheme iron enzyme [Candidatus Contendobacter sp.]